MKIKNIINPGNIFLFVNVFSILIYLTTDRDYFSNYLSNIRYYDVKNSLFFYSFIVLIVFFSSKLSERIKPKGKMSIKNISREDIFKLYYWGISLGKFIFSIQFLWIGYTIIKTNGRLINSLLKFNVFTLKKMLYANNLTGVTTLTLLSSSAIALYSLAIFQNKYYLKKKFRLKEWIILLMPSMIRGMFFGERLAIYENLIIILTIFIYFKYIKSSKKINLKFLINILIFFLLMFILYSYAESKRSFESYFKLGITTNWLHWGFIRLSNYFITSLDSGLKVISYYNGSPLFLTSTFGYLPFGRDILKNFLINYSHLEYNTFTAIGFIYFDFKYFSFIYFILIGILIGVVFKNFLKGKIWALLSYPLCFLGVIESYRIYYYGDIRFQLQVIFLIIYFYIIKRIQIKNQQLKIHKFFRINVKNLYASKTT